MRRSKHGHALYLTAEGGVRDAATVVASSYPVAWNIQQTEDGIRCVHSEPRRGEAGGRVADVVVLDVGYRGRTLTWCSTLRTGGTVARAQRYVHGLAPIDSSAQSS